MKVLIVGSGNIATWLLSRMAKAPSISLSLYARDQVVAKDLAHVYNVSVINDLAIADGMFDIIILAVSDNVLGQVFNQYFNQTIVIHCSGATSIDVLSNMAAHYGVMWPIYSIKKHLVDQLPADIPLVINANTEATKAQLQQLAHIVSAKADIVTEQERAALHLGATVVNNFTNHLYAQMQHWLQDKKIDFNLLIPIMMQQSLLIPSTNDFQENQTGAAIRGDENTIQNHLAQLEHTIHLKKIYELMTASIQATKKD